MSKIYTIGIILVVLTIVSGALNIAGKLAFLNDHANRMHGPPDKHCETADDCAFQKTTCHTCDCGEVVRKDWRPMCPFRHNEDELCKPCPEPRYKLLCVDNQCTKQTLTDAEPA